MKTGLALSTLFHIIIALIFLCPIIYIASDAIKVGNTQTTSIAVINSPYWLNKTTITKTTPKHYGSQLQTIPKPKSEINKKNITGKNQAIALFIHDQCQKELLPLINTLPSWVQIKTAVSVSFIITNQGNIIDTQLINKTSIAIVDLKIIQTINNLKIPPKLWPKQQKKFILPIEIKNIIA